MRVVGSFVFLFLALSPLRAAPQMAHSWPNRGPARKFTFDDNTETRSTARYRQRSLSFFSLDGQPFHIATTAVRLLNFVRGRRVLALLAVHAVVLGPWLGYFSFRPGIVCKSHRSLF